MSEPSHAPGARGGRVLDYVRLGIQVMVSQTSSGELTVGNSHRYGKAVTPFDDPMIDGLVLDYLRGFLDVPQVQIASRWNGVYVTHPTEPYCVARPAPGAVAVIGFGSAGMTLSFGATAHAVLAATEAAACDPSREPPANKGFTAGLGVVSGLRWPGARRIGHAARLQGTTLSVTRPQQGVRVPGVTWTLPRGYFLETDVE